MDLEVSEPIDFSSGDHQHLVRKAADSNTQIKSGQTYTTSPSEPRKTRRSTHSKTRERADTYVVQISDETTPNDSSNLANPFSDASVRRAFIIKVFLILSAQLVVTGAIVSIFIFWPAFFVVLIVLACCGKLRRKVPANYILLGLFRRPAGEVQSHPSSPQTTVRMRLHFYSPGLEDAFLAFAADQRVSQGSGLAPGGGALPAGERRPSATACSTCPLCWSLTGRLGASLLPSLSHPLAGAPAGSQRPPLSPTAPAPAAFRPGTRPRPRSSRLAPTGAAPRSVESCPRAHPRLERPPLSSLTVLQGLLLGAISVFYNAEEVLWATAATALVTLSLTLFALQTKWDFTMLNGMLFVLLFVLIIYGILLLFIRSYWLHLLYAGLGTIVFSLYLVMDVQLMVGGRHHHSDLDPEEYVFAALNIYLDIINLFLFILQLIGLAR
ncbi:uncharacterized protein LOC113266755 [Ursus arctos]|uniref:uncharacterized protein LOC113266755 n=1 Tax=Ursus arctos TaxID=9644 RepID=UPI002546C040|nr:uncharacterized protein LOC113266755 [Ursus arctos]